MKKCTLVVGLLLCLALNPLSAQGLEEKVAQALSTLDYSEATTGILYEKIPTYVPFDYFDGSYFSDSTSLVKGRYLLLYGMLDKAHTTASNMMLVAECFVLFAAKKSPTFGRAGKNRRLNLLRLKGISIPLQNAFPAYAGRLAML